ncbi:MAG: preprotein translocase subunit SecY [Candidatus Woesearchaeota archaeon]
MGFLDTILTNLPEVQGPSQRRLGFKTKLKWTILMLVAFFILGLIPLYGLGANALQQFEFLSIILGASFGSIISLGIGPIVTASIVLQLLQGSGLVKFDLTSHEGKARFTGIQKLLSVFFVIFEAIVYVQMGGLSPAAGFSSFVLIFQLFLGGVLIMFMDEVVSKWGFGSGISLFIAAGVSQTIFVGMFSWLHPSNNPEAFAGAVPELIRGITSGADPTGVYLSLASIISTLAVFAFVVYVNGMKVEIPLSFGRVRGHGVRWPLSFLYTSNIPVILVAALIANIQLFARLLEGWVGHATILGGFSGNAPVSGLAAWLYFPNIVQQAITGSLTPIHALQAIVYLLIMMGGAILFSWFWVQTAGLDAKSQAQKMMESGLQIPGFRKDKRILERMLDRYIMPLTIMGGATVGLIAGAADLVGAIGSGTGLLLTVMIVYRLYEEIAQQHLMDMNPMMRKFIAGN